MLLDVMANNNTWSGKSKLVGLGASLKITPSNSPILRPVARPPQKPTYQSALSLQTVIGTTTSSPNGFSSHEPTQTFALCAGSAAILADFNSDLNISQRFFRARPTATAINPVTPFYHNQPTPPTTPDARSRPSLSGRSVSSVGLYSNSPVGDWGDPGSSKTWTSRERIKAVTSVAISPNGRFLAVGETGYNPRVLIFSTAKDSLLDIPLTILTEHSFGVRGLAFSTNSQYLATLGDLNDGFLFVWAVNLRTGAAKLHSTNKCTSFVRDMCWIGNTLITVGIRHVKVWRLADVVAGSPTKLRSNVDSYMTTPGTSPKALSGRNCLLGLLGDATFTCVTNLSDTEALVCSDSGAVCFLDDTEGAQKLSLAMQAEFGITSVAVDTESGTIWLGGRDRRTQKLQIEDIRASLTTSPLFQAPHDHDSGSPKRRQPSIVSMGFLSTHMVTIDSTRAIHVCPIDALGNEDEPDAIETSMPAHRDAVLGIGALKQPNLHDADFFTWSCGGTVNFWNTQGKCQAMHKIELEQLSTKDDDLLNELRVLRVIEDVQSFVSGDRYGVLRVMSGRSWQCTNEVRAHSAEVTDLATHSSAPDCLVASSGRDRMVQLFKKSEDRFDLIQTMDEHVGAVSRLLFMKDGEKLLSCSADRTVIIRERVTRDIDSATVVAFILSKVITLKVSPMSMTLMPDEPDALILSTIDRQIQRFDVPSARHIHSFKASDSETNDSVVMTSMTISCGIPGQSPRLLLGVSSTDKSLRVYDVERDTLLTREFGHTEGVSDVLLLEGRTGSPSTVKRTLISTGLDGVVMIWDLSVQQQQAHEPPQPTVRDQDEMPMRELTATKPPLRRILSRTELAGFQRQDNLTSTPTPTREQSPQRLRKKVSRYLLAPQPARSGHIANEDNLSATPTPLSANRRSPTLSVPSDTRDRTPSPPSPKSKMIRSLGSIGRSNNLRHSSLDFRPRTKSSSEFGSLNMSTEQVCRTLRAYRKKLNSSNEYPRGTRELERELDHTIRALEERAKRVQANGDTETDSSGKENERKAIQATSRPSNVARRVPSTPNLAKKGSRLPSRSRSLDADGEG